jgi:ABC-2 type transport system ATP-binding protein
MLTIRDFEKKYSDRLILSIPYAEFIPGVHWIKGENGSGKSTLFKSISGMIPFDGSISFDDGTSLRRDRKEYLQRVTYCEAEPSYPGFISAFDLFTFVGKARGAKEKEQRHYSTMFGIDDYLFNSCESYSSGMLKKVSLALSFLGSPELIVLDEPLITLDSTSQAILLSLIQSHVQNNATTFLISSHQQITFPEIQFKNTFTIKDKTLVKESANFESGIKW